MSSPHLRNLLALDRYAKVEKQFLCLVYLNTSQQFETKFNFITVWRFTSKYTGTKSNECNSLLKSHFYLFSNIGGLPSADLDSLKTTPEQGLNESQNLYPEKLSEITGTRYGKIIPAWKQAEATSTKMDLNKSENAPDVSWNIFWLFASNPKPDGRARRCSLIHKRK